MEEIKIETLTDMFNAVKKYPDQIDILMTDIKNFIETNIALQNIFSSLSEKLKVKTETKVSPYIKWIPDNKNNISITIKTEKERSK
jgi:hypothetical protein